MIGTKGILFTAFYVSKFEAMDGYLPPRGKYIWIAVVNVILHVTKNFLSLSNVKLFST